MTGSKHNKLDTTIPKKKKVGLLFDSINDNTGDIAIGIVLEEFCQTRNIDYEVVDPLDFNPNNYSKLIIGGGHLLRDPGDPFYDRFRVKGNHILNSIGITTNQELGYLNDYDYVSVRTQNEKKLIEDTVNDVNVVPCMTIMMKGENYRNENVKEESIGIHLTADALLRCPEIEEVLNNLNESKVFVPFTHYNKDRRLMQCIHWNGDHYFLDQIGPQQLFDVIGCFQYVIVSSLHATIFAYAQNVPFLTLYQDKVFNFLKDRKLEELAFNSTKELKQKLEMIKNKRVDFSGRIAKDRHTLQEHMDNLEKIIKIDRDYQPQTLIHRKNDKCSSEMKNVLELKNNQLEDIVLQRDKILREKYEEIFHLRKRDKANVNYLKNLDNYIEKLKKVVNEKDKMIEDMGKMIEDMGKIIEGKEKELLLIKSSKFWKLRNLYYTIRK